MTPSVEGLYAIIRDQMLHTVGLLFGTLLTGVLFTLGISSISLLTSRISESSDRSLSRHNYFLRVYVIVLLFTVFILDVESFILGNYFPIFSSLTLQKTQEALGVCGKALASTTLAIGLLADGILVWRCFMVQRALGPWGPSKWGNVLWAFPACLWILTLVTGIIAVALPDVLNPIYPGVPGTIGIASNSLLNIYATLFLTIRLLAHRKMVKKALGDKALRTMPHLFFIAILLESAAVNVPIAIAVAVGLVTGRVFGGVVGLIAPPSQALASVIIIHQVALGRAVSQGREDISRTRVAPERSLSL